MHNNMYVPCKLKKTLYFLLLIAGFLNISCVSRIGYEDDGGFLYQISDNKGKVSYLFGTMHNDGYRYSLSDVYNAFPQMKMIMQTTTTLVPELRKDLDLSIFKDVAPSLDSLLKAYGPNEFNTMPNDVSYWELFDKREDFDSIDTYLRNNFSDDYYRFKPLYWYKRINTTSLVKDSSVSIDQCLWDYYIQRNKDCYALETFRDQLETKITLVLDSIGYMSPLREQAKKLYDKYHLFKNRHMTTAIYLDSIRYYYLNNDSHGLQQLLSLSLGEEADVWYEQSISKRNRKWLPKIKAILSKQSCLVAVGSSHLFGPSGLIKLLRDEGYKVTPLKHTDKLVGN